MAKKELLLVPGTIKVERSERAQEQVQVVSQMISKLNIEKSQNDELIYQLSKLLLLTEMDCVMAGYAMGLEAVHVEESGKKGKWLI